MVICVQRAGDRLLTRPAFPPEAWTTRSAHAIFLGYSTLPGLRPVEVLVTASCTLEEPWLIRLCCVNDKACQITTWGSSRGTLFDGLTKPVASEGVTVQPLGFALLFSLDGGHTHRSLIQLDRAEVASFLVRGLWSAASCGAAAPFSRSLIHIWTVSRLIPPSP
ncbi:hypothetical protein [Streptomyces sp. NPDC093018]|uniref:hypothetical protein n=1 Tax=Streptomyces sp. NPDC093018 TaxID=3155067 RepID=UPI0034225795